MTNHERITALQLQVVNIQKELLACKPSRCTSEDIEDVSDNYQANLEYGYYKDEQQALIADIEEEIASLQLLNGNHTYDDLTIEEISWPLDVPTGMHYGTDRDGNTGYFEDFEQSIGE